MHYVVCRIEIVVEIMTRLQTRCISHASCLVGSRSSSRVETFDMHRQQSEQEVDASCSRLATTLY